jgi:alkanesulfonate monooxygenase SsuD/methylene tetrahydromethanopterin reductase-like flavin-dependent oxidoreductase (luciferase family)
VRLGATLAHLADAPPRAVGSWAQRLVDAGFESLWTPEIIGRGPLVPDPFVLLAVAAGVTQDVELGTATVQVPLHHPAELAHRVLSLMAVYDGRLTLGVSPGSSAADYAALERDFAGRFAAFSSAVARLRVLLAEGHDERAVLAPADLAAGGPALLLGSWGHNVERAAREFDGWLASGLRRTPDEILAAHDRFRAAGGRRAVVCAVPVDSHADLGPTGEVLHRYAQAGFDDAVVVIGPDGPDPKQVRALLPI